MRLERPTTRLDGDLVRVTTRILRDDGTVLMEPWLGIDRRWLPHLDRGAGPFLPAAAVLAAAHGEALDVPSGASPLLVDGVRRNLELLAPDLGVPPVPIHAPASPPRWAGTLVGQNFTRGVDATHAVLRSRRAGDAPDLLIAFTGVERHQSAATEAAVLRGTLDLAAEIGIEAVLVHVDPAIRPILDEVVDWRVAHGSVHAAPGLLLGPILAEVRVGNAPSSGTAADADRPEITEGWSTERTRFVAVATELRLDKLRDLAEDDTFLRRLKVCWSADLVGNCGRCSKCLMTMTLLKSLGALDRAPFPRTLTPEAVEAAPTNVDTWLPEAIAAVDDDDAELRRAWRLQRARALGSPVVRLAPIPPIGGIDPVTVVERAVGRHGIALAPTRSDGIPFGWGPGALEVSLPSALRHRLATRDGARPLPWLLVGERGPGSARASSRLREWWGDGAVAVTGHVRPHGGPSDLPADARSRLVRSAAVVAWWVDRPWVDGALVLEAALGGAVPIVLASPDVAAATQVHVPSPLRGLVRPVDGSPPGDDELARLGGALSDHLRHRPLERVAQDRFRAEAAP